MHDYMPSQEQRIPVGLTGQTIGHYRVEDKLGEGGVGEVYRAVDVLLGRIVAIKRLRPELAARPQIVERFHSEARTLAQLSHPNIATLYGLECEGDELFMVMEFIEGRSIWSLLRQHRRLTPEQAFAIFFQTLDGIGYVHSRAIVHRDIKGSNLLIDRHTVVKVVDFGIARVLGSQRLTRSGQMVGTPEFMSPEQVRGEEPDVRSDIYSLGILLILLLAGRLPFDAKGEYEILRAHVEALPLPLSGLVSDLAPALDGVLQRALDKDAEQRFQTIDALRSALLPYVDERWVAVGEGLRSPSLLSLLGDDSLATSPAAPARPSDWAEPTRLLSESEQASPSALAASLTDGGDPDGDATTVARSLLAAGGTPRRVWTWIAWLALIALLAGVNWLWARDEGADSAPLLPEKVLVAEDRAVAPVPPPAPVVPAAEEIVERPRTALDAPPRRPTGAAIPTASRSAPAAAATVAERVDSKHTSRGRQPVRSGRAVRSTVRRMGKSAAHGDSGSTGRESETRSGWKILRH